jgi:YaiO family outer membrane protein
MKEHLRLKPGSRLRGVRAIALSGGLAVLLAAGAGSGLAQAGTASDPVRPETLPGAPKTGGSAGVRSVEVGGGYGRYTKGLGRSDSQYLRAGWSRPWHYGWTADVGREHRFGETSIGYGASYTQFFPGRTSLAIAVGSGTGRYLAPRYRVGVTATGSILGLVTSAGYLRTQSKAANWSDGVSLGLLRYTGHWIFGVSGRQDYGYPGRTVSRSGGAGVTYYQWRRTYVGANVDFGDVSYMLVGPAQARVNFNSTTYSVGFSQWLTSRAGVNLRVNSGRTSFYKVSGVTVSLFREW